MPELLHCHPHVHLCADVHCTISNRYFDQFRLRHYRRRLCYCCCCCCWCCRHWVVAVQFCSIFFRRSIHTLQIESPYYSILFDKKKPENVNIEPRKQPSHDYTHAHRTRKRKSGTEGQDNPKWIVINCETLVPYVCLVCVFVCTVLLIQFFCWFFSSHSRSENKKTHRHRRGGKCDCVTNKEDEDDGWSTQNDTTRRNFRYIRAPSVAIANNSNRSINILHSQFPCWMGPIFKRMIHKKNQQHQQQPQQQRRRVVWPFCLTCVNITYLLNMIIFLAYTLTNAEPAERREKKNKNYETNRCEWARICAKKI